MACNKIYSNRFIEEKLQVFENNRDSQDNKDAKSGYQHERKKGTVLIRGSEKDLAYLYQGP